MASGGSDVLLTRPRSSQTDFFQVSKGFRDITHHPAIWKALYYDVSFMRPFRPFPSTSFESALVKSAQLAQSWTSKPLRRVSRVNIPFRGNLADTFRLIGGRWFIACQRGRRFVLYDTYANAETHVPLLLWEQEEEIVEWDEQSGVSEAGHCVVYLLAVTECPQRWYVHRHVVPKTGLIRCNLVGHF